MKQMSQIKGFGRQEIAHLAPVNSIKELEEKQPKHQSLIEKCLKSLVKQKLTGCLINMGRKKRETQERSHSNKKIQDKSYQDLYGYLNSSIKKRRYVNPELKSFFPDQNSSKETRNPSTMMSINERISKMSQKNKDRYRLINETEPVLEKIKQDLNIHRISQIKRRIQPSFISSIQLNEEEKQGKKSLNTSPEEDKREFNSQIRLPKLDNRSSSTIIKNVAKKNSNYNINHDFWKYLTNQNETSIRKRKTSTTSDINLLISINQAAKQVKSSLFKPTIPSSSKQNFQAYLNSLPTPFKRLIEFVISFFNIKMPNQLSALFYSKMLDDLNAVNRRAWSIVGFVFWDFNRDGIINSKDLFDIFRQFNQFDQIQLSKEKKAQNEKIFDSKQISSKSLSNKKQDSLEKQRPKKKQNEIHTEILLNIKQMERALKRFKPEFEKQKEKEKKEGQNQFQELKNFENAKFNNDELNKRPCLQLQNVQKAIEMFKSQILKLNFRLSSGTYSHIDYEQLKEPEEKLISFLQEIVLTQSNLKYEDIQPLFSAGANTKEDNEHKLQLFPKDLNVKCSSSYKQCFVSTEHNEETRLLREKIQYFKLKLKEKRCNKNKILQQKIQRNLKLQKEVNYVKAAQSTMGQTVKDILFNLLGYQE